MLEDIHVSASQFANRLNDIESSVEAISSDIKGNNEVLASLQKGLLENLTLMEKNISIVDKRVESICNK